MKINTRVEKITHYESIELTVEEFVRMVNNSCDGEGEISNSKVRYVYSAEHDEAVYDKKTKRITITPDPDENNSLTWMVKDDED